MGGMKVLIAAKHAPEGSRPIGGVQSWSRTVKRALQRAGHEAVTWGPEQPMPAGPFDLGILANIQHTRRAAGLCGRVVAVCHGIIPAERPPADLPTVYTSEGVRDYWDGKGRVIRQPIDLQFWAPSGYQESRIVRYSYRGGLDWIPGLAARMGFDFEHVQGVTHEQAREKLRRARVVLASGRAALEAAACGARVVICDDRHYQGPLLAELGPEQAVRNYSGRGGVRATEEALGRLIWSAKAMRDYVKWNHDADAVTQELLNV